jgi:hypothetical protein
VNSPLVLVNTLILTKALEIIRLNITMQPLIQGIFSQIDSSPYFPESFCDISCMRFFYKTKSVISCK